MSCLAHCMKKKDKNDFTILQKGKDLTLQKYKQFLKQIYNATISPVHKTALMIQQVKFSCI